MEMTTRMKIWLKELYEEAAKEYYEDAECLATWPIFFDDDDDDDNEAFANEHREFARILEKMASEIDVC